MKESMTSMARVEPHKFGSVCEWFAPCEGCRVDEMGWNLSRQHISYSNIDIDLIHTMYITLSSRRWNIAHIQKTIQPIKTKHILVIQTREEEKNEKKEKRIHSPPPHTHITNSSLTEGSVNAPTNQKQNTPLRFPPRIERVIPYTYTYTYTFTTVAASHEFISVWVPFGRIGKKRNKQGKEEGHDGIEWWH